MGRCTFFYQSQWLRGPVAKESTGHAVTELGRCEWEKIDGEQQGPGRLQGGQPERGQFSNGHRPCHVPCYDASREARQDGCMGVGRAIGSERALPSAGKPHGGSSCRDCLPTLGGSRARCHGPAPARTGTRGGDWQYGKEAEQGKRGERGRREDLMTGRLAGGPSTR